MVKLHCFFFFVFSKCFVGFAELFSEFLRLFFFYDASLLPFAFALGLSIPYFSSFAISLCRWLTFPFSHVLGRSFYSRDLKGCSAEFDLLSLRTVSHLPPSPQLRHTPNFPSIFSAFLLSWDFGCKFQIRIPVLPLLFPSPVV